jgi:hypothetical protein
MKFHAGEWLSGQIEQHGPWSVFWAALTGVLAVVGLVTAFAANVVLGSVVATAIILVALIILLVVSRTELSQTRGDAAEVSRAMARLQAIVLEHLPTQATNVFWRDWQVIDPDGDLFTTSEVRLRIEGGETARSLHFVQGEMSGERITRREQRQVRVVARRSGGARLPVRQEWTSDDTLRYTIYFEPPIPPGEEIEFAYDFAWPRALPNLGQGRVEHTEWVCERPTESVEVVFRLEKGFGRTRPLGLTVHGIPAENITQDRNGGAWEVRATAQNLPKGHEIIFDLDPA